MWLGSIRRRCLLGVFSAMISEPPECLPVACSLTETVTLERGMWLLRELYARETWTYYNKCDYNSDLPLGTRHGTLSPGLYKQWSCLGKPNTPERGRKVNWAGVCCIHWHGLCVTVHVCIDFINVYNVYTFLYIIQHRRCVHVCISTCMESQYIFLYILTFAYKLVWKVYTHLGITL